MEQAKFKDRCQRHPEYKIEYLKISNSEQSKSKPFFYCTQCINTDSSFNADDYQLIKEIILSGGDKILLKYPSITKEIMNKLIQVVNDSQSNEGVLEQVNNFFTDFRKSINLSIDSLQKKMIQIAELSSNKGKQAIQKYKEISKLSELRELLLKKTTSVSEKERQCMELIKSTQSQDNSELIKSILNNLYIYDPNPALLIQQSILQMIETINLFKKKSFVDQINVKLVPTKIYDGLNCQKITNVNNQSQVVIIKGTTGWMNTVSDICINPDLRYCFRFKIDNIGINTMAIGLMQNQFIDIKQGCRDQLCCQFKKQGEFLCLIKSDCGIEKQQQGEEQFRIRDGGCIEMRICQRDKILQLYDYPEYKQKLELEDQHISKLTNAKELKLYIALWKLNEQVTLTEAMTVELYD